MERRIEIMDDLLIDGSMSSIKRNGDEESNARGEAAVRFVPFCGNVKRGLALRGVFGGSRTVSEVASETA
jgi:hypothetical protein